MTTTGSVERPVVYMLTKFNEASQHVMRPETYATVEEAESARKAAGLHEHVVLAVLARGHSHPPHEYCVKGCPSYVAPWQLW